MDIEQILGIKGMKTLKSALPCFCRRFSLSPEDGWGILKSNSGDLEAFITQTQSDDLQEKSRARKRVNAWWEEFHRDFDNLGLGQFSRVSRASQAEASYELLVCLCFLTERLKTRQLIARMTERAKVERIVKPKPKLFVKFWRWIRQILKQFLRRVGMLR